MTDYAAGVALIAGIVMGCVLSAGRCYRAVTLIRKASRRMRHKYRARLVKMELGWRKRDTWRRSVLGEQEGHMRDLMSRLVTVQAEQAGPVLGFYTRVDERLLYFATTPHDYDEYLRYVALQVGHLVEREIRTLNARRLPEMMAEPRLEPWTLRRTR